MGVWFLASDATVSAISVSHPSVDGEKDPNLIFPDAS